MKKEIIQITLTIELTRPLFTVNVAHLRRFIRDVVQTSNHDRSFGKVTTSNIKKVQRDT